MARWSSGRMGIESALSELRSVLAGRHEILLSFMCCTHAELVSVTASGSNIQQKLKRESGNRAERMLVAIGGNLLTAPRHVSATLYRRLHCPNARGWIICAVILLDGKQHQST